MEFSLFIQPNAKTYFLNLLAKNNTKNAIKLGFKIAGCNGYQYVLDLADSNDILTKAQKYNFSGINFIIDDEDIKRLNNVIIDYKKSGLNQLLTYDNPNISYECGCGESVTFK